MLKKIPVPFVEKSGGEWTEKHICKYIFKMFTECSQHPGGNGIEEVPHPW